MVTIQIGDKTIEAENLQAATRQAKKIEKINRKEESKNAMKREMAYAYAESNFFKLYNCLIAKEEGKRRGWTFDTQHHGLENRPNGDYIRYESEKGTAYQEHYGFRILGCITNGAGFDVAVKAQSITHGTEIQWWLVGVNENQCAFQCIPDDLIPRIEKAFAQS